MSRLGLYVGVALIVVGVVVLMAMVVSVPRAPIASTTAPSAVATAAVASGRPSPSGIRATSGPTVLDARFGFVIADQGIKVRSEVSDAVVASVPAKSRSFTSLSHTVSPDGRSLAYWDPVAKGAVLHVRTVAGRNDRSVLTAPADMSGNAFTWSSDGGGLVIELDNDCLEICAAQGGKPLADMWTVDLASGATQRIASATSGKIWIPVAWDRAGKIVAAGVTGPGGYITGNDVVDLAQQTPALRSFPLQNPVLGQLKASDDGRSILLAVDQGPGGTVIQWWPAGQPDKPKTIAPSAGINAAWRSGTSEIWWVDGLAPAGCRTAPCKGTQLISFDVASGKRTVAYEGDLGARLVGFRPDGSAAITASVGSTPTTGGNVIDLVVVQLSIGKASAASVSGAIGESVRLD